MALQVNERCIGCGACESACSQGAISQAETFPVIYLVDPMRCNDCMDCVTVCPIDALVPDPRWAVCFGRGCPLGSSRFQGWECSQGNERCPDCSSMMWREPGGAWVCSVCRLGEGAHGAHCPKPAVARRLISAAASPTAR